MKFIKWFEQVSLNDIGLVGGKNASLGQMVQELSNQGIDVPRGFAITALGYWRYLEYNHLLEPLKKIMSTLTTVNDMTQLHNVGEEMRNLIKQGNMPDDLGQEIDQAYAELSKRYGVEDLAVAVRSSGTAEDLPTASFAGQQETYLNVRGNTSLLMSCKQCFASLFTDRAIVYRTEKGFDHWKVALSIGVQKMVRSDLACAGVAFSLDTETGYDQVIMINGSYGLGETIVQGWVVPDEFIVHKPTLMQGFRPIIRKKRGEKQEKLIFGDMEKPTKLVPVSEKDQEQLVLTDDEILSLARMVYTIEQYYTKQKGSWSPMDIEWAKDGVDGKIYIVQARPETIHGAEHRDRLVRYRLTPEAEKKRAASILVTGRSIGQKIVTGKVKLIASPRQIDQVAQGDIVVTEMTDPDWVPIMKRAAGIITDRGGRTCHAAIVSRELGLPAMVGAHDATKLLHDGQLITLDCSRGEVGYVYDGHLQFEVTEFLLKQLPQLKSKIMVNIGDPDRSFSLSFLPVDGVGLARLEFIITDSIKAHPMALLHPEKVLDEAVRKQILNLIKPFEHGADYFVSTLSEGIAMIAAGFYPRPVIVRLSDFKSNEYRNLLGGSYFEPIEENPMLGFRGAFRYDHVAYREAFALEMASLLRVRTVMGLKNVKIMIPFVRTIAEAKNVIERLETGGLKRHEDGLELVMMCEVPSNVILIDQFCDLFDGFSIGSNDLTQLTLGVDRDSSLLASEFNECDPAVMTLMKMAITGAHNKHRYIGICGQAPSDFPDLADQLMKAGIDSLSLNPDAVIPFLMRFAP